MIIYPIVAVSPLLRFQQVLESVFRLSSRHDRSCCSWVCFYYEFFRAAITAHSRMLSHIPLSTPTPTPPFYRLSPRWSYQSSPAPDYYASFNRKHCCSQCLEGLQGYKEGVFGGFQGLFYRWWFEDWTSRTLLSTNVPQNVLPNANCRKNYCYYELLIEWSWCGGHPREWWRAGIT